MQNDPSPHSPLPLKGRGRYHVLAKEETTQPVPPIEIGGYKIGHPFGIRRTTPTYGHPSMGGE